MGLDGQALDARLELARTAAREAGQLTLQFFRSDRFVVERKDDDSPVTIADREAELLLRQKIESAFPNDGIVGEEFGQREGHGRFPLDSRSRSTAPRPSSAVCRCMVRWWDWSISSAASWE